MVNIPFISAISKKNNSNFMAKQSFTLSDRVLYDDASLYIAKEGEKLYFNFKKKMIETYNVLEAISILINEPNFEKIPIWNIEINELDKDIHSISSAFYWLCHIEEIEEMLNLRWNDYCDFITHSNKNDVLHVVNQAKDLRQIKDGIINKMNYDKIYCQLIDFVL